MGHTVQPLARTPPRKRGYFLAKLNTVRCVGTTLKPLLTILGFVGSVVQLRRPQTFNFRFTSPFPYWVLEAFFVGRVVQLRRPQSVNCMAHKS